LQQLLTSVRQRLDRSERSRSSTDNLVKLHDELLAREVFDTLLEAKVLIERWQRSYNIVRPRSSLGYQAPPPEATQSCSFASATPQQTNRTGMLATPTLI
jgi:putative transposase